MNTKNKIAALQGEEQKSARFQKVISGTVTGLMVLAFAVYVSRTVFMYLNSHHF